MGIGGIKYYDIRSFYHDFFLDKLYSVIILVEDADVEINRYQKSN